MAPDRVLASWVAARAGADCRRVLDADLASQLDSADAVVVHDWLLFRHYLNWRGRLVRRRQLAILMDHSPRDPSELAANDWAARWGLPEKAHLARHQWQPLVLDTFRRADAILVPNRHSLDAYFPGQEAKRKALFSRPIMELPSGVPTPRLSRTRAEVRRELGLPEEAVVVGYLGRFEQEKGYDIFVEAARQASRDDRFAGMRFIAAGQGPLQAARPPQNLVQLGWRKDAPELLNAVDILLAPNRFAYFDLVILEAMSLGKTVYTTFVGGSKGLAEGSVKFLGEGSPAAIAQQFLSLASGERPLLDRADVLKLFAQNYSEEIFLQRHLQFAADIRRRLAR